jgi:hypothetical protein
MLTFKQAKASATKKNADKVFVVDGHTGNSARSNPGWTSEVFWCSWRKRQVWTSISPRGARIV